MVVSLVAACLLAGCNEPPPSSNLITGSTNVVIHSFKYVPMNAGNLSSATNNTYYVICQVTFTNTLGYDTSPQPKNFHLVDAGSNIFVGVDSGNNALIGISNYGGIVKNGDKQDYTIAFAVTATTGGTVYYESN